MTYLVNNALLAVTAQGFFWHTILVVLFSDDGNSVVGKVPLIMDLRRSLIHGLSWVPLNCSSSIVKWVAKQAHVDCM